MSVDMHEYRVREEIEKLPYFEPKQFFNRTVRDVEFPAWRAIFSSLCYWGHSTGYRLPSFEVFHKRCEQAYTQKNPRAKEFKEFFAPPYKEAMTARINGWYESGMAETYLYACLVDAIEDKLNIGVVLYDARADWKLKADAIVIIKKEPILISAFTGHEKDRANIEAQRDVVEKERKKTQWILRIGIIENCKQ